MGSASSRAQSSTVASSGGRTACGGASACASCSIPRGEGRREHAVAAVEGCCGAGRRRLGFYVCGGFGFFGKREWAMGDG
jgi:hypothetical protein